MPTDGLGGSALVADRFIEVILVRPSSHVNVSVRPNWGGDDSNLTFPTEDLLHAPGAASSRNAALRLPPPSRQTTALT
jgi:hypothetical protein